MEITAQFKRHFIMQPRERVFSLFIQLFFLECIRHGFLPLLLNVATVWPRPNSLTYMSLTYNPSQAYIFYNWVFKPWNCIRFEYIPHCSPYSHIPVSLSWQLWEPGHLWKPSSSRLLLQNYDDLVTLTFDLWPWPLNLTYIFFHLTYMPIQVCMSVCLAVRPFRIDPKLHGEVCYMAHPYGTKVLAKYLLRLGKWKCNKFLITHASLCQGSIRVCTGPRPWFGFYEKMPFCDLCDRNVPSGHPTLFKVVVP